MFAERTATITGRSAIIPERQKAVIAWRPELGAVDLNGTDALDVFETASDGPLRKS
jgi:hypothetical protein